jgi:general secretion pathway protein D
MRSLGRSLAIIIILLSCGLANAESPRSLWNKGAKAEARQDYEAAYDYYKQAYDKRPDDLKYRVSFERTRFLAAASKVKRGQRLREQGKLQEALELFAKAVEIDPSNDLAQQEIKRTQDLIKRQAAPEGKPQETPPPTPPEEDQLHQLLEKAGGPVRLGEISNASLSAIQMPAADSKQAYETIGKIAGINVLFDPDYQSRKIPISLKDVTLQQALDIVALESRTFWRPVTPNTIFVAADNTGKRRELEQSVIKTFYLGNVATPTDLQDVVNAIRTILEVQRIQQIPSQNAIVVRGTPDQLALAQKMIDDIDKSKPEVIVDVVVAQVRHDKVRQMGLLPPQTGSVALQGTNTTTTGTGTGTGTGTTTTTTTGNGLNFNDLQHLNSTNYAVTISPLSAQLIFNDANTKILENPQIRAADGIKASLNVGDRIPIATGSFGTPLGIGTGVGALGVNTQFQYIDVGVTIEITPHVHPDNEISLKATLTISNQTGTSSIGGISQPIISQRKVDHEIRLKDGEINMIGGILEDQVTLNTAGVPFLSKIPLLKYLFSQEDKERHTNEVVFLLVPHIVRGQLLSTMNRKAFDVGTGTAIDLRMTENGTAKPDTSSGARQPSIIPTSPAPMPSNQQQPGQQQFLPAQQQAPPIQSQPTTQAAPNQTPPVQPNPVPNLPAQPDASSTTKPSPGTPASGAISLRLDPGVVTTAVNGNFNVSVALAGGQDVGGVSVQLTYDPKVLQFGQVVSGEFLGRDGQAVPLVHRNDASTGTLLISAQRPPGVGGVTGDGVVFSVSFTAKARGASGVAITVPGVRNSQNQPLQALGSQTTVNVN